jgi:hypothetical protein
MKEKKKKKKNEGKEKPRADTRESIFLIHSAMNILQEYSLAPKTYSYL